jgi:glycosyltransferase involved in cell wall biosynthesis
LINEISHFAEHFTKVYVFVPEKQGKIYSHLPENVLAVHYQDTPKLIDKIRGISFLFSSAFWRELKIQRSILSRGMRLSDLSKILHFMVNASFILRLIRGFSKVNRVPFHKTVFYNTVFDHRSLALSWLLGRYRVKGVFLRYSSLPEFLNHGQYRIHPFRSYIFKHSDAVFFPSQHSLVYASERYGYFDATRMIRLRQGVPENRAIVHSVINNHRIKVISVSFLEKYKRVDLIIEALEGLEGIDVDWHHIGDGSQTDNVPQNAFNRLFNKPNIHFRFTSDSTPESIRNVFINEQPDVFISLSEAEDIPVSLLEALSFGVPVISTNVGGISEIITHSVNGFLLPQNPSLNDVRSLLVQIVNMDKEKWKEIKGNALQTWREYADASKQYQDLCYMMLQMSRIYEE